MSRNGGSRPLQDRRLRSGLRSAFRRTSRRVYHACPASLVPASRLRGSSGFDGRREPNALYVPRYALNALQKRQVRSPVVGGEGGLLAHHDEASLGVDVSRRPLVTYQRPAWSSDACRAIQETLSDRRRHPVPLERFSPTSGDAGPCLPGCSAAPGEGKRDAAYTLRRFERRSRIGRTLPPSASGSGGKDYDVPCSGIDGKVLN